MPASVLVGAQWGDEGKGKVTDLISGDFDVVCRYAGGANAGHTVIAGDTKLALHQVPSGVMYENTYPVIGNGCIVDPEVLLGEIEMLEGKGISCALLKICGNAQMVMSYHDELRRGRAGRRPYHRGDRRISAAESSKLDAPSSSACCADATSDSST